jgi:hypothetical protein
MASASQFPFQPLGKTHLLVAASPAPAPIQVEVDETTTGSGQYRIVNAGTNTVFLGVGATAAQATARAAAIVAGTPTDTIVLLPGAVEVLRFNNNAFFTGFASSATDLYITPGQGL